MLSYRSRAQFGQPSTSSQHFPCVRLFVLKYGSYPLEQRLSLPSSASHGFVHRVLHVTTVMNHLRVTAAIRSETVTRQFHPCSQTFFIQRRLIELSSRDGIFIHFDKSGWSTICLNPNGYAPDSVLPQLHYLITEGLSIFYLHEHDAYVRQLISEISDMCLYPQSKSILQMITKRGREFNLQSVTIHKPLITDLALHYGGDKFLSFHDTLVKALNKENEHGIALLHGLPGSGIYHSVRPRF